MARWLILCTLAAAQQCPGADDDALTLSTKSRAELDQLRAWQELYEVKYERLGPLRTTAACPAARDGASEPTGGALGTDGRATRP